MIQCFCHVEQVVITWEQFLDMFYMEYVSLVERELLAHESMSVTEISKMFIKRAILCPKYAASG